MWTACWSARPRAISPPRSSLNKIDLGVRAADEELLEVYRRLGLPVFKISLRDPAKPEGEMAELKRLLAGARTVLSGHSGVGKSTLLLALDPALTAAQVRTAEVSTQTSKGVHTTTHACLYQLALGVTETSERVASEVIDTPGVREFTPADTDRRNLWGWFPELVAPARPMRLRRLHSYQRKKLRRARRRGTRRNPSPPPPVLCPHLRDAARMRRLGIGDLRLTIDDWGIGD